MIFKIDYFDRWDNSKSLIMVEINACAHYMDGIKLLC